MGQINLNKAKRQLVGMVVPKQLHGNIGNIVESVLEDLGYKINKGAGPDLDSVEVKTRGVNATSSQTIGKLSINTIAKTPYTKSIIKKKFQSQFRVKHKENPLTGDNIIVSAEEYDFTDPLIQKELRAAYEHGRSIMIKCVKQGIEPPDYIAPAGNTAYWERTDKKSKSWEFRMRSTVMARYESIAKVNENPLFVQG